MIRRVLFIGDVCRGDQSGNVARIHRLFSPVFKQLGVDSSIYVSDVNLKSDFDDWLGSWKESLASDRKSCLGNIDLDCTAVVGFELPELDIEYLNQCGVPWVNFAIHPIRFLDDLYFEVTTSFDYDLQPHAACRGLIDLCVNILRTKYADKNQSKTPPTLAIFGQSPFDKSVYFNGEFYTLDKYLTKLDDLASEHDRVLFRPHPYLTDPKIDQIIYERYGAIPCSGPNFYELFVNSGITTACAISSSVITEAPYFDIHALYLDSRAKIFGLPINYRLLLDDQVFWNNAFLGHGVSFSNAAISLAVPANYLRSTFASWGYVTREQEVEMRLEEALHTSNAAIACAKQAEAGLYDVYNSNSWRITLPLRVTMKFLRTFKDRIRQLFSKALQ